MFVLQRKDNGKYLRTTFGYESDTIEKARWYRYIGHIKTSLSEEKLKLYRIIEVRLEIVGEINV